MEKTEEEEGEREKDDVTAQESEQERVDFGEDVPEATKRMDADFGYRSREEGMSAIDRQYATQPNIPRRIHIVGTGAIGKLVAHALRGLPDPPPVTLLFHRPGLVDAWEKSKKQITIHDDGYDVVRTGFDIELAPLERVEHGLVLRDGTPSVYDVSSSEVRPHEAANILKQQQEKRAANTTVPSSVLRDRRFAKYMRTDRIDHLIVTTKAAYTVNAISRLKPRLHPTSTVCFLQNGMGIVDEVNAKLFPDPRHRPNYAQGILNHGANVPPEKAEIDPFYAVHAGHGTIALGLLPRDDEPPETPEASSSIHDHPTTPLRSSKNSWKFAPTSRHLLRTLTRSPVLCAVGFTPTELLQQQLEKLAVNSIINPLTALLDARNGALAHNFALTRTMRLLLAETSTIIRSLPELQNIPNVRTRFSAERLETIVVSVANRTRDNVSSMLADVRAGLTTEIEYINGYIVRRGEEVGIKAVVNYAIMQTVKGKAAMVQKDKKGEVVMEGERERWRKADRRRM